MSREDLIQLAKIAEQAERYEDMKESMDEIVKAHGPELSNEERNLLSVAYKNLVGAKRSSWRIVSAIEQKGGVDSKKPETQKIQEYRTKIEQELNEICDKVIDLLDDKLINEEGEDTDSKIFYLKMKGDYLRYKVEVCPAEDKTTRDALADKSAQAYGKAYEIAKQVRPTDPIRLGLALNFSVFHYEIKHAREDAINLARAAFDDAISELGQEDSEHRYKDSTLILQLLRDNLTLWQAEDAQQGDECQELDDD